LWSDMRRLFLQVKYSSVAPPRLAQKATGCLKTAPYEKETRGFKYRTMPNGSTIRIFD